MNNKEIMADYSADYPLFTMRNSQMVTRKEAIELTNALRALIIPAFFSNELTYEKTKIFIAELIDKAYRYQGQRSDPFISDKLLAKIPLIADALSKDLEFFFISDPACRYKEEILLSYPGFYAILIYRIAHEMYLLDIPYLPRMISEVAHSATGIDINLGAKIGESFFIDHGTGIVIGETTIIGKRVKIYQGVTLGALSVKDGRKLADVKRHPTIEDNVTIYSNASILGGDVVIGANSIIGGNTFITRSIPSDSIVLTKPGDLVIKPLK